MSDTLTRLNDLKERIREFKVRESLIFSLIDSNVHVQSLAVFCSASVWFHLFISVIFNFERINQDLEFLEKWNHIIGDWIFEMAFLPMRTKTGSRFVSSLIVYFMSALLHDYVLYGTVGFFLPLHILFYPFLASLSDISSLSLKKFVV